MSLLFTKSDELANDPTVLGSPVIFRLFSTNGLNSELIGSCIVFYREEPTYIGTQYEYYESKGLGHINSLFIEEKFRGIGFGMTLLQNVMHHLYSIESIRYLEVDDATDFSGQSNSIYVKAGFRYDVGDNHMLVNLRHVLTNPEYEYEY
jgi:GNAT superfamily N-acetyltransferase